MPVGAGVNPYAVGVFLVYNHWFWWNTTTWKEESTSGSHMSYNDLYWIFDNGPIQFYGARNTSAEKCFSAKWNYWVHPDGPDDEISETNDYYNCAIMHDVYEIPKVDGRIDWADWTGTENAIELNEFKVSAYTGKSIICEWSTGSERDNAGFYLVKSEYYDKGYTLVNNKIIPAKGSAVDGYDYSYIDQNIKSNTVYFYWLVDVNFDGTLTIHGPAYTIYESEDSFWKSFK
jgi:hypothetical protein